MKKWQVIFGIIFVLFMFCAEDILLAKLLYTKQFDISLQKIVGLYLINIVFTYMIWYFIKEHYEIQKIKEQEQRRINTKLTTLLSKNGITYSDTSDTV